MMKCSALHIIFFFLLFSCNEEKNFEGKLNNLYKKTVPFISSEELQKEMERSNILLLDVRTKKEYFISHIKGAISFEYKKMTINNLVGVKKNNPIRVYCTAGYRSERMGEQLLKAGFKDVKNLYGGVIKWKNSDYNLYNVKSTVTDSVHT